MLLLGGDKAGNWQRWYRDNIPTAERLYLEYMADNQEQPGNAEAYPQDWEIFEQELHAAGVSPEEIEPGTRLLLAQARGHQLAQARKDLSLGRREIAATMDVSVARVSQIEHGEVTSFEVIARYVKALGGRLDLVADSAIGQCGSPVSREHGRLRNLRSVRVLSTGSHCARSC